MPNILKKTKSSWFVYILLCDDGSLYTGITTSIANRFLTHQLGKGARYTKSRGAKKILYKQKFPNRSVATKRELEIKRMTRQEKLQLISLQPTT